MYLFFKFQTMLQCLIQIFNVYTYVFLSKKFGTSFSIFLCSLFCWKWQHVMLFVHSFRYSRWTSRICHKASPMQTNVLVVFESLHTLKVACIQILKVCVFLSGPYWFSTYVLLALASCFTASVIPSRIPFSNINSMSMSLRSSRLNSSRHNSQTLFSCS